MEFLLVILVIYLLIRVHGLASRVEELEKRSTRAATASAGAPLPPLPATHHQTPQEKTQWEIINPAFPAVEAGSTVDTLAPAAGGAFENVVAWVKEDWILKLGAFLLLIGFGWLTTYAFINNWIGPQGRIALGLVAGALILVLGFWRIKTYIHQGGIFIVLGSTTILLTIFAARFVYQFFTPVSALAAMLLTAAFVAFASVRYKSQTLALAGMTLAALAPLFTSPPRPYDYEGLFVYLLVVTIGALWVIALSGWRTLTTAALLLISLYSLPHLFSFVYLPDRSGLLMLAFGFALLFYATNTLGILKTKTTDIKADLVTAGGNGLFLLAWILVAAPAEWTSLLIALWMILFAVGAFVLFRTTGRREPFYVYAGVAVAMLGAATAEEAAGATLTFFYTIESFFITYVSYALLKDYRVSKHLSLLFSVPLLLSSSSISSPAWRSGVLHKDFVVLLLLAAAGFGLGLLFREWKKTEVAVERQSASSAFMIVGLLYAFVLIWKSFHALLLPDTAVMSSLIIYTIVGLWLYFRQQEIKTFGRLCGALILGGVMLRLLTVDIWNMDISGKIITFFLIGALLMSTAFIGKKPPAPTAKVSNP